MGFIPSLISLIIIVFISFTFYSFFSFQKTLKVFQAKSFQRVEPIYLLLAERVPMQNSNIYRYAQDPITREMTYKLLYHFNKEIDFPSEFCTILMGAESNLFNWLEFPTELNAFPDQIEHIKKVSILEGEENPFYYHVYRFRVDEPHISAKSGWMIGVVGPYFQDSKPFDTPTATFSRLKTVSEVSPEEETVWVHDNIFKREPNIAFLRNR
jgi:hypothetical protein